MKIKKFWLLSILIVSYISTVAAKSPAGNWTTIDDKTGKKRSEVYLSLDEHHELSGKIMHVYAEAGDTGICKLCPGVLKNKPIKALTFLWGLKENQDGSWSGGDILDPKTGKVYHVKMIQKGNKLYVRGYVGLPVLGRTQIWQRSSLNHM